jgi:hypothetical protein
LADIEENYLTPDEFEAGRKRRKLINAKLCLAWTRGYADKLTKRFRPFEM